MDELHLKFSGPDGLPRLHRDELGGLQQPVLLQLQLDKARGQAGAVNGHIDLLENVGNGADMILMPVGDKQPPETVVVLHQIADIGDDTVNTVHIVTGERHAAVHHDDLTAVFICGHVLADLVETAKGNDFKLFCHKNSFSVWKLSVIYGVSGENARIGAQKKAVFRKIRSKTKAARCPAGPASPESIGAFAPDVRMLNCAILSRRHGGLYITARPHRLAKQPKKSQKILRCA